MARTWGARERSVDVEPFDLDGAYITLTGDLDVRDEDLLREVIGSAIAAGYHRLVIDFTRTTFFDAGAYRVLLDSLAPLLAVDDAKVVLGGAQGCVARLLEVVDADRAFLVYLDRDVARRALRVTASRPASRAVSVEAAPPASRT